MVNQSFEGPEAQSGQFALISKELMTMETNNWRFCISCGVYLWESLWTRRHREESKTSHRRSVYEPSRNYPDFQTMAVQPGLPGQQMALIGSEYLQAVWQHMLLMPKLTA